MPLWCTEGELAHEPATVLAAGALVESLCRIQQ